MVMKRKRNNPLSLVNSRTKKFTQREFLSQNTMFFLAFKEKRIMGSLKTEEVTEGVEVEEVEVAEEVKLRLEREAAETIMRRTCKSMRKLSPLCE